MFNLSDPVFLTSSLIILIFSAILHEVAHGFVADRLGDPTARLLGRLTLDPRPHIDPLMTIAIPLLLIITHSPILFGGAKPVPVDPFNLRDGRKDLAIVSLAGPLTNILLAVAAALIYKLLSPTIIDQPFWLAIFDGNNGILIQIVAINLWLAIFNLLPIPPLDGSKVFSLLLPEKEANTYMSMGNIGMIILFVLLLNPIGGFSLISVMYNIFSFTYGLLGIPL